MGMAQQRACWPIAEQELTNSSVVVGTVGAVYRLSDFALEQIVQGDSRLSQFRSARPRTSVAQHCALPVRPEQRGATWRAMLAGMATAAPARARMVRNCMVVVVWVGLDSGRCLGWVGRWLVAKDGSE
jgi:hypothetical protein